MIMPSMACTRPPIPQHEDKHAESSVDEVRAALLAFVTRSFMVNEADIDRDRSLIDQGIIDSFGLVEITAFIFQHFEVEVREEDMTREAFGSLNKMAKFVARRIRERA